MKRLYFALFAVFLMALLCWIFQDVVLKSTPSRDHSASTLAPVNQQESTAPLSSIDLQTEAIAAPDQRVAELKKKYPQLTEAEIASALHQGMRLERLEQAPPGVIDLKIVTTALDEFKKAFGEYPVGDNTEIAKALLGENPMQTVFLDNYKERFTDSAGALADVWKTPLLIEVKPGGLLNIRSAGPDRVFGSRDDVYLR